MVLALYDSFHYNLSIEIKSTIYKESLINYYLAIIQDIKI